MKIKYSLNGLRSITPCPNGNLCKVASWKCVVECSNFIEDDERKQEVTCSYDKTGKE